MRELLLERKVLFVGGKGGVGKTTTAAALGLIAARAGRRCLLVSTDPAHSLGDIFERAIGDRETALAPGLWGLEIDPEAAADRYIATVKANLRGLVAPALYGEIERQMDLARLAPGAVEAALLDRVSELMAQAEADFDLVIFDTAPTGHTLRLLSLPEIMAAWTDGLLQRQERSQHLGEMLGRLGGRRNRAADGQAENRQERDNRIRDILLERRRKFHRARRLLLDPARTAFVLVLNPEKLPILESRKALTVLRQFNVPVAAAVINRVLPPEAGGEFLAHRRRQEARYLAEIEDAFGDLERHYLPLLPRDVRGLDSLMEIGRQLLQAQSD